MSNIIPPRDPSAAAIAGDWPAMEAKIEGRALAPTPEPPQNMRQIAQEVCDRLGVTMQDLCGPETHGKIARARQEFMWLAFETGRYSNQQIANFVNRTDHSFVVYGRHAHERRMAK